MKKLVPFMIIALLFLSSSCKKLELDFSWEKIAFAGSYTEGVGSEIRVEGWARILQSNITELPQELTLFDWIITLYQDDKEVLSLFKDGVYQKLGTVLINESDIQTEVLWVYINTDAPIAGQDIFNGMTPNKMTVQFIIRDFAGNILEHNGIIDSTSQNFSFQRN